MLQNILLKMDHKIIQYFNQFVYTLVFLEKLLKCLQENLKEYQKKVSKGRLQQTKGPEKIGLAVKFNGNCLRQDIISLTQKNVVNSYIVYEFDKWSRDLSTNSILGYSSSEL